MYRIGARTFNKGAGIAAAALLAAAGPHVAFSRMALTDAPFFLAWLAALWLGGRFLERPGTGRAVAFGLAVGIAQNVKYNGWIIGAILAATVILDCVAGSDDSRRRSRRALRFGVLAAIVAAVVYAPWFLFVERHGGYGAVLKVQRGYLMPATSWLPNLRLQLAQWVALSGLISGALTWGAIGWALAWIGRHLAGADREPSRWSRLWTRITLLGGIALMGVLPTLPWWLGLGMVPWLLRDARPAVRLIAVGWIALTILTPFYHPYARLLLPLQGFCWLIAAGVIGEMLPQARLDDDRSWPIPVPSARGVVLTAMVAAGLLFDYFIEPRAVPYPALLAPSDSLKSVAAQLAVPIKKGNPPPEVRVYARPPLAFYLNTVHGIATTTLSKQPRFTNSFPSFPLTRWILTDEVLYSGGSPSSPPIGGFVMHGNSARDYHDFLNLTTLLDVDPHAAYGTTEFGEDGPADWRSSQTVPFKPPSVQILATPQ
jgi:hypothetical protein